MLDPGQGAVARLKQGMSVETTIHTGLADVNSNLGVHGQKTEPPAASTDTAS